MSTILEDVKRPLGVRPDNLGFDAELLIFINAAKAALVQNGVDEFEDLTIDSTTNWPVFANATIADLVKDYLIAKTKLRFDPSGSETVNKAVSDASLQYEGRIRHEIDEVANA